VHTSFKNIYLGSKQTFLFTLQRPVNLFAKQTFVEKQGCLLGGCLYSIL